MGGFSFEKAMALAKAAKQGESFPPPEPRHRASKTTTEFDFETVLNRARQARPSRADEERADSSH